MKTILIIALVVIPTLIGGFFLNIYEKIKDNIYWKKKLDEMDKEDEICLNKEHLVK